ncbi:DNA polymerase-3 subunit alpha [Sporobacter termitidis DSM 10068]|uniref:DNA polymerase III PolC-type n=1 Tax=Sporobacter termitidis DSM 10068 TaxID=1123282 RepID=A0A1M5VLI4_9FIRM|nr:PolC-type DNA polymerase III [Sporobacter termitidis]SHH75914.1 DNA polymerase-3 subunit alpha [Sporobacter termitidis DSM 10068]
MSGQNHIPFFEMFSCCRDTLSGTLENSFVVSATVDKTKLAMKLTLLLPQPIAPIDIAMIEQGIKAEFGLNAVSVLPVYPRSAESDRRAERRADRKPSENPVIYGREARGSITPMDKVTLELGKVTVRGEVFDAQPREITKRNAWVMNFDITDYTGSVHVSKFMTEENAGDIIAKIKKGMVLTVSGNLGFNRFDGELTLEPTGIVRAEKEPRLDTAEEKRVELHLHTKMSAMDAVTDTGDVVRRAIEWGHPAIAITDHGVVQSFPDAMKAAGDKIKVLYGVEGYYINDVDDKLAVFGDCAGGFEDEIVVFDIETTGLKSQSDTITEIGAVVMKDGKEIDRFQTFADPGMHIPPNITQLTGITDADVKGAPSQEEAVRAFLGFAGGRTLCAHNASFDIGFIYEACGRYGIDFEPRYIDTLAAARALLPDLKSHRLNTLADFFSLPEFNHHRASDDAVTAGLVLMKLFERLRKNGVTDIADINGFITRSRAGVKKGRFKPKHIILLARTQAGVKNMYKLITKSHLDHFNRYPIIPKSELQALREGILIGSACEAGEVFNAVVEGHSRLEQRRLADFYDYLEIQPISNNNFMLFGEHPKAKNTEDLRNFNRRIIELGRELQKPVVATCDVHFMDPHEEIYRHILLTSKGFEDADRALPLYFRSTDEMLEEFAYLGKETAYEVVVKNTRAIAELCDVVRPLPPAKTLYAPKIENSAEDLKKLVYDRMHELYGPEPPELVTKRVETELNDILMRHYDVIYMSAQKLVADSLAHGYLVGSRGSVGSSIVAYMSGITEVNALPAHYRCKKCGHSDFQAGKGYGCGADMPDDNCPVCGELYFKDGFDIPFETFLGFGGDKVPDIDLNFSGEYQANAHKYTNELFGSDHVFRAGTIGTVAEKTAFGYVKKYLESVGRKVPRAEENRLAQGCVGVKRTTGQHPGGLVVIPQDMEITDFCPAQHPADDSDTGIVTTHFEYHCMEDNLLKLDELGHDDPTMIRMLEDLTGVNAKEIPLDDPDTMAIFKSPEPLRLARGDEIIGETGSIGIPEFGTGFTRQMLNDTQPDKFDTLVRLSGFSHGTDVWLGNAKDIILSGTATISETIGCRDDIMLYLISKGMEEKAAFKIMESVRKGRGLPEGAEEKMAAAGVPEWYITSCKKIKYLFPKAHAVAYVTMAFRIAWFKVHEPLAFYSAYFYRRSQKDGFDAESMTRGIDVVLAKIREIRNNPGATAKEEDLLTTLEACYEFYMRGFEFAEIDLYESDAVRFKVTPDGLLRPPFVAISGLGETAARDIVANRDGRQFISIEEFSMSCPKVSKTHIEQMKNLGALAAMPETSQLTLF